MNTQTCAIGRLFPANSIISAGPKLLAGFTEVPVNGIPKICTSVRVSPITKPATAAFSILARNADNSYDKYECQDYFNQECLPHSYAKSACFTKSVLTQTILGS